MVNLVGIALQFLFLQRRVYGRHKWNIVYVPTVVAVLSIWWLRHFNSIWPFHLQRKHLLVTCIDEIYFIIDYIIYNQWFYLRGYYIWELIHYQMLFLYILWYTQYYSYYICSQIIVHDYIFRLVWYALSYHFFSRHRKWIKRFFL